MQPDSSYAARKILRTALQSIVEVYMAPKSLDASSPCPMKLEVYPESSGAQESSLPSGSPKTKSSCHEPARVSAQPHAVTTIALELDELEKSEASRSAQKAHFVSKQTAEYSLQSSWNYVLPMQAHHQLLRLNTMHAKIPDPLKSKAGRTIEPSCPSSADCNVQGRIRPGHEDWTASWNRPHLVPE